MFFIQEAHAQAASPGAGGAGMIQLVVMIGIFAVMWFFMIAPQRKRVKEHKAMVEALKKGDEVMTGGGLMGRIIALDEQAVDLEIARGTSVRIQRQFVTQVLPKGSLKSDLSKHESANEHAVIEAQDNKK